MFIFESEEVLGVLFSKLALSSKNEISCYEIEYFDYCFLCSASQIEKTFCRIDRASIIKFTDKYRNFLSYNFATEVVTIKESTKALMLHSFKERYVEKFESYDNASELELCIDNALNKTFTLVNMVAAD